MARRHGRPIYRHFHRLKLSPGTRQSLEQAKTTRPWHGARGRVIDNQVIRLRNGQIFIQNRGRLQPVMAIPQPPHHADAGVETLDYVRPVGDRIILATSAGRLCAIELKSGKIAWQTRASDTSFEQIVNSDDFLAARFTDNFGPQIISLDTFSGQIVWRRIFSPTNGQTPVNMALAPDGTLLFTLPDRLCAVDLYEPRRDELKFGDKIDSPMAFAGANGPDQLVTADGRVLAVADNGQFVRVLSIDSGKEVAQPLSTGASNWNVSLRVVGPRLYVINQHAAMGYSLDHPEESWSGPVDPKAPMVRDAFIGKRHLVLLGQPDADEVGDTEPPTAAGRFQLMAYGRYPRPAPLHGEAGRIDQTPIISNPAGIQWNQWQPVDGGFYYRSIDRQAHYLKGAAAAD